MSRCLVGVSGGIDSLFAAIKLQEDGFDVYALHMYLNSKSQIPETAKKVLSDHRIKLLYADYTNEFNRYVVDYFTNEYAKGYTPNPCVVCNRDVKLPFLFKEAESRGIETIATGHYADRDENGLIIRHKSRKDQSYFLACVDRDILKHTIFPLKDFAKEEIRKALGLNTKDSSDLCFVKNNYRDILKEKLGTKKGEIVKQNKVVGYHTGFYNYTIGQRKGIQIGSKPHYVVSIDARKNIVYADEETKLYSREFYLDNLKLLKEKTFFKNRIVECVVRYNTKPKPCRIDLMKKRVVLLEAERAVTPGQVAVFYENDKVVGCGKIDYGIH